MNERRRGASFIISPPIIAKKPTVPTEAVPKVESKVVPKIETHSINVTLGRILHKVRLNTLNVQKFTSLFHKEHRTSNIRLNVTQLLRFVTVGASAATLAVLLTFDIGYNAYANSEYLGVVSEPNGLSQAIDKVNIELFSAGEEQLDLPVELYMRLVPKGQFTSYTALVETIRQKSKDMTTGFALYVDNERLLAATSEERLQQILQDYKARFTSDENAYFDKSIEIKPEHVPYSLFMTDEKIFNRLEQALSVVAKSQETQIELIEFETERIETDQLVIGQEEVTQGEYGERHIVVEHIAVNGENTIENVISDQIVKQPVNSVIRVGTGLPPGVGTGEFARPCSGSLSSPFGQRWGRQHKGLDFEANVGTEVTAADSGVVSFAGVQDGFGNIIIINHNNGFETYYAHLSAFKVAKGDVITKGQLIALSGNTGRTTGPHLHLEIRENGVPKNPADYIN